MLKQLRKIGVSSSMLYMAGFGSIAASMASWVVSLQMEDASVARADRWGIFVGEWAPTFFALGTAMRLEEQWGPETRPEVMEDMRARAGGAVPVG